ncbi:MAG: hypothetical protein EOO51_13185 [Flavobacterium sp.]|nr:MAG: hypothetical protein EOO51_13185 [Flavobacterium sp.]
MRNTHISLLFTLLLSAACQSEDKQGITAKNQEAVTQFPHLIYPEDIVRYSFDEENPTWLSTVFYQLNYLGKLSDTVTLENGIRFSFDDTRIKTPMKYKKFYTDWLIKKVHFQNASDANVEILVGKTPIANSLPVLLRNNDHDTIAIGHGEQVPMIMEALNEKNQWQPIQETFIYMCGNGVGTIILPPGEIAITLAPLFKGNQKTRLRLVLGTNMSKPFWGYINPRQFTSMYNEHGNFNEEYRRENPQHGR